MLFQKKLDRAQRWSRKKRMEADAMDIPEEITGDELLPTDEELRAEGQKIELEKGDLKAMILAGLFTILPACIIVLLLFALLAYLFISVF